MNCAVSATSQDILELDFTRAKVVSAKFFHLDGSTHGSPFLKLKNVSMASLRRYIFHGIDIDELNENFSSVAFEQNETNTSFVKSSFFTHDGCSRDVWIRPDSSNSIKKDIMTALKGALWNERLFKYGCDITFRLQSEKIVNIKVIR
jgi:hypothetical protein